jgi:hypothetical protein
MIARVLHPEDPARFSEGKEKGASP